MTRAAVRHVALHAARELADVYRRRREARAKLAPPAGYDNSGGGGYAPAPPPQYGALGQGAILYNSHGIENVVTSLADAIRVADDYGKFAFQYRLCQQPLIGMHGSYAAVHNAVELDFGFDHGEVGAVHC